MNRIIKVYFLLYITIFNSTTCLFAGEDFGYNENSKESQGSESSNKQDDLNLLRQEHKKERENLKKEYDKKQSDLEKERIEKKQTVTRTNDQVTLIDPTTGRKTVTYEANKVDNHYDKLSKNLKDELKQKISDLQDKQNQQHDALVEKQIAASDALSAQFNSNLADSRNQPKTQTSLGDALDINNRYKKAKEKLQDAYDNTQESLQSTYEEKVKKLAKEKQFYNTMIETKTDGLHWTGDKVTKEVDGKKLKGDQILDYYDKQLTDLKTKYQANQKQALDDYNRQLDTQEKARLSELKKINIVDPTTRYVEEMEKTSKPFDEQALAKQFQKTSPRQINDFVDQFSRDIVKDLTPKQKEALKEVIFSLKEQINMGESFKDIVKNHREDFSQKLNLTKSQQDAFDKAVSKTQETKGFFTTLLEALSKFFGKK